MLQKKSKLFFVQYMRNENLATSSEDFDEKMDKIITGCQVKSPLKNLTSEGYDPAPISPSPSYTIFRNSMVYSCILPCKIMRIVKIGNYMNCLVLV